MLYSIATVMSLLLDKWCIGYGLTSHKGQPEKNTTLAVENNR